MICGRNMERRFFGGRHWGAGVRNPCSKTQCRGNFYNENDDNFSPNRRWYSKIVRKRLRFPRIQSETGTHRKERRSQWRTSRWTGRSSTDRINRWRWSPCRLLVDSRWLQLSSSQWTSSSTLRAEGRISPLWYIDVIRSTHTDLDAKWNLDGDRNVSGSWTGFTRFTLLNETSPKGYIFGEGVRLTSRPDHVWPDAWTRIGKAAQRGEKQEWAIEKPEPEHSRKLRGVYSIDPSDEEYKDIIQNARRQLETAKAAAMPCKRAFPQAMHAGNRCFKNRKKPRHLKQRPDSVVSLKPMNPQDKK